MKKDIFFILMLLMSTAAFGNNANDIMKKSVSLSKGFVDSFGKSTMILKSKDGQTDERHMSMKSLEVKGDGNKQIIVFNNPPEVRGTAFLTHAHIKGNDDQWIYLPALRRVKRISSSNKSGSFMGSEFSYEDLGGNEYEKFTYKYLGEAKLNNKTVHKIEKKPAYEKSGYSKQIAYIEKDTYLQVKIEMYDLSGKHYKTMSLKNYKKYLNNYWQPKLIEIVNHQNGKSTIMKNSDEIKFKNNFSKRDFEKSALKRAQ